MIGMTRYVRIALVNNALIDAETYAENTVAANPQGGELTPNPIITIEQLHKT
jgi:hypothetical protein